MNKQLLFPILIILLFNACKKGDQGTPGVNGSNGSNGNANVSGTILTANGADWQWDPAGKQEFIVLADSQITQSIYDSGSVAVYQQTGSASWITLPYTFAPIGASYQLSWFYMHSVGHVTLFAQASDLSEVNLAATTGYYKVVCTAAGAHKARPTTSTRNQAEEKQLQRIWGELK